MLPQHILSLISHPFSALPFLQIKQQKSTHYLLIYQLVNSATYVKISSILDPCLSFNSKSPLLMGKTNWHVFPDLTLVFSVKFLLLIMWVVLIHICFIVSLISPASNFYCPMARSKMVSTWYMLLGRHFIWPWHSLLMFPDMASKFMYQKVKIRTVSLVQYEICLQSWPKLLYYCVKHSSCLRIFLL